MIVGFTTGKSGSTSMAEWLDLTHESRHVRGRGDVSWFNIFSLDYWLEQPVTRILLMRDKDKFVDSFLNRTHYRGFDMLEKMLPQFDFRSEKGVGDYWDWYNNKCLEHEDKFIVISPLQIPIVRNERK